MGDHPRQEGTTYGAVDSPARPSMAAIDGPGGPFMATKFAVDGSAGPVVRTIGGMTEHRISSKTSAYVYVENP